MAGGMEEQPGIGLRADGDGALGAERHARVAHHRRRGRFERSRKDECGKRQDDSTHGPNLARKCGAFAAGWIAAPGKRYALPMARQDQAAL